MYECVSTTPRSASVILLTLAASRIGNMPFPAVLLLLLYFVLSDWCHSGFHCGLRLMNDMHYQVAFMNELGNKHTATDNDFTIHDNAYYKPS